MANMSMRLRLNEFYHSCDAFADYCRLSNRPPTAGAALSSRVPAAVARTGRLGWVAIQHGAAAAQGQLQRAGLTHSRESHVPAAGAARILRGDRRPRCDTDRRGARLVRFDLRTGAVVATLPSCRTIRA